MSVNVGCGCNCTTRIFDQAKLVLDTVVAEANACGIELPAWHEVCAGDIVHDCEKVSVGLNTTTTGIPLLNGSQTPAGTAYYGAGCGPSWTLNFLIAIVRCGPKIGPLGVSSPEAQTESANERSTDAGLIMNVAGKLAQNALGAVPVTVTFANRQDFVSTVGSLSIAVSSDCSHSMLASV